MANWSDYNTSFKPQSWDMSYDGETSTSMPLWRTVITCCAYLILSIVAVVGNILVLTAIHKNYSLRESSSNHYLANLAVTDFFQGAISLPLRTIEVLGISYNPNILCRVTLPISIFFGANSNFNIFCISIDRFLAIYFPYFYSSHVTFGVVHRIMGLGWFIAGVFAVCAASAFRRVRPTSNTTICRFPTFFSQEYIWTLYTIIHIIPIITTVILYGFIVKASLQQARRIKAQEFAIYPSTSMNSHIQLRARQVKTRKSIRQGKAAKLVSIILGLFIVLVVPIITIDVIEMLDGPKAPETLTQITVCMIYANHGINVFVYAGFNSEFRNTFRRILRRWRQAVGSALPCM